MPPTIQELHDRLTRIEFAFAQLRWAVFDASPVERAALPSRGFSADEVERIVTLLGEFASIVHHTVPQPKPQAATAGAGTALWVQPTMIDCPGPKCKATETAYQEYKTSIS